MSESLFRHGKFPLHSGAISDWKIDCDALTEHDWETLALMAAQRLPNFEWVEGVPRGGLPFAEQLAKRTVAGCGVLLIAEDVVTTGTSMERQRAGRPACGICVFSRGTHFPRWITPLFQIIG